MCTRKKNPSKGSETSTSTRREGKEGGKKTFVARCAHSHNGRRRKQSKAEQSRATPSIHTRFSIYPLPLCIWRREKGEARRSCRFGLFSGREWRKAPQPTSTRVSCNAAWLNLVERWPGVSILTDSRATFFSFHRGSLYHAPSSLEVTSRYITWVVSVVKLSSLQLVDLFRHIIKVSRW